MSKYIDLGKVKELVFNADISMAETEALYKSLDELPTIDIVKCEECMWYNNCLQFVTSIDRTATALRWCSDGERIDNE